MDSPHSPAPLPATLPAGTRFANYEIVQRLGCGGMGEIYRARDLRLGREVAIKTISAERHAAPGALARFEQEARTACALNHPNIVTIYEFGQSGGIHYIAMELVAGETLRQVLTAGPLPFRKVVTIATQVADALAKAHEIGLIHRDLKPENLMVASDGAAKILDFGLAKLLDLEQKTGCDASTLGGELTQPGSVMGTLGYMSPEQANGGSADFRSDQFSFGAVLYEMVTGRAAFRRATHAETLAAVLRDEPERIAATLNQAPAPFCWIIERCLAKEPAQRYASTRDLARDLAAVRDRIADAPARNAARPTCKLPVQRTPLVGRNKEAAALVRLLQREDVRLVTLTGPGGIGKTRLATQVAGEIASTFAGGVCFVPLSSVTEAAFVITAVAQAAGVRETGNQTFQEGLEDTLGALQDPMLLVLDNFEHLVAAAPDIAHLLSVGPRLKVVVTSQSPLHLYGEHEFPVLPLGLPDSKSIPAPESLMRYPAVALFVERAQAVKREFQLTRENAQAVVTICERLDGLPLAIELAAARVKLLSPAAMLGRLESSLNLLTGGARDLPLRQQTLRGTVEWSHSLLNAAEQILFRRLSVFIGGCTLDAVEAVCDTKGDLGIDIFDGMSSMVDKSLVQQVEPAAGETRFAMLSTIRDYALERLAASGEEAAVRRAHAAYFLVLAEEGAKDTSQQDAWLDRFELEHDNFRSALSHLMSGDAEWAMRLGAALFRLWEGREYLSEGREALAKLLQPEASSSKPKLRARLLFAAAVLAGEQGDYTSAQQLFSESLDTCRAVQDDRGIAVALNALGVNARDRGDVAFAAAQFEQCLGIWREIGDAADIARALSNLASVMKLQREFDRASSLYDECLSLFRKAGDSAGVAWTLNYQGDLAREQGDSVAARALYEEALSSFRQLRDGWGVASSLADLATLSRDTRDHAEAHRLYAESIRTFQEVGHKRGIARALEGMAVSAAAQSQPEHALQLAGAAAALRQRLGAPLTPAEQNRLESALESARRSLSTADGLKAWMEGWTMSLEEAIEHALDQPQAGIRARSSA